jgi:hypothetical protein
VKIATLKLGSGRNKSAVFRGINKLEKQQNILENSVV